LAVLLFAWTEIACGQGPAGSAAGYPSKPVRVTVGFAPGGGVDILARVVSQKLGETMGRTFVVENRPGAGGTTAYAALARAPADGYNLLAISASYTMSSALHRNLPYDPVKDFAPITLVGTQPYMLIVHPSVPAKSVAELVALAKSAPEKISFSHTGVGSATHLAGALLESAAGVTFLSVPYKSPAHFTAVISGEVSFTITSVFLSWNQVQAGKIRALAVTGKQRSAVAPNVPTMIEAGVPGYEMGNWYGLLMPAATPSAIVSFISIRTNALLKRPDTRAQLAKVEVEAIGNTPQEFAKFIGSETAKFAALIKHAGIKAE
jgi:tripartite-type tricarboxylate transporter receptor subunit TctC